MKTNFSFVLSFVIFLFFLFGLSPTTQAQINLNKLKNKAIDMDYYELFVPSQLGSRVTAKRLEFDYEILKENISKGNVW